MQAIHKPEITEKQLGFPLQTILLYREGGKGFYTYVKAFGRERDKDNEVVYYWVEDFSKRRFKAFPNELTP